MLSFTFVFMGLLLVVKNLVLSMHQLTRRGFEAASSSTGQDLYPCGEQFLITIVDHGLPNSA